MKKNIITIIIIIVMFLGIIGVWLIKNNQKNNEQNLVENNTENINPDFALNVTGELDIEKLKSYNLPIIIDFGAEWCPPCNMMKPDLIKLNKELQGEAIIRIVDVDQNIDATDGYKITLLPTQIFINSDGTPYIPQDNSIDGFETIKDEEGNVIYTMHVGILTRAQILNIIEQMKK